MKAKTTTVLALVLRCYKGRERDLLVTLLTREQGKLTVVAKGVAHLRSHKRPYLETGNLIKAHLVETKGLSLLTQAQLHSDTREIRDDLASIRKFLLFMEILDRLLVNEELSPALFQQIIYLRELFLKKLSNRVIRPQFSQILQTLGFTTATTTASISQQVSGLLEHELCSFDYLQVPV